MLKFVILMLIFACALATALFEDLPAHGRIVGGEDAPNLLFLWQVSVQRNREHFCGGTIISPSTILSAAHCFTDDKTVNFLEVYGGSTDLNSGGVYRNVKGLRIHEKFNSTTSENDVALIYLKNRLPLLLSIWGPIGLATESPTDGAKAIVSGWGTTSFNSTTTSRTLQYAELNIIDQATCQTKFEQNPFGKKITNDMLCAAAPGKDACQGDSGGPLISGGKLVGVVSWGIGCVHSRYPGVYTNVAVYQSWVYG